MMNNIKGALYSGRILLAQNSDNMKNRALLTVVFLTNSISDGNIRQRQKRFILPNCDRGTLSLHDIQKATAMSTGMDELMKVKLLRKININIEAAKDVTKRHNR
ncbi:MAG: hypothetical protein WCP55_13040 [Lentisphaerota bacterium]